MTANDTAAFIGLNGNFFLALGKTARTANGTDTAIVAPVVINGNPTHYSSSVQSSQAGCYTCQPISQRVSPNDHHWLKMSRL
jgi:hypothetical protein